MSCYAQQPLNWTKNSKWPTAIFQIFEFSTNFVLVTTKMPLIGRVSQRHVEYVAASIHLGYPPSTLFLNSSHSTIQQKWPSVFFSCQLQICSHLLAIHTKLSPKVRVISDPPCVHGEPFGWMRGIPRPMSSTVSRVRWCSEKTVWIVSVLFCAGCQRLAVSLLGDSNSSMFCQSHFCHVRFDSLLGPNLFLPGLKVL